MASAGVGLFLSSLRRAFSGGIFIELRSLFAILRGCAPHQSFRSLSDLPGRADSKVALHLFDRRGRGGQTQSGSVSPPGSFQEPPGCSDERFDSQIE